MTIYGTTFQPKVEDFITNGRDILREIEIIFPSRFSRQVENFMMTGHAFILNGQNVHDDV